MVWSTRSDCAYLLNWDTETYNASTGQLITWVKIPTLSHTVDTTLTMCYGDLVITTYQGISTATWNSNYLAVWHFRDGSTLSTNDATNNGYNGTNGGDTAATGYIDGGLGQTHNSGSVSTSLVLPTSNFTYSFWINSNNASFFNNWGVMGEDDGGSNGSMVVYYPNQVDTAFRQGTNTGVGDLVVFASGLDTGWHYVSISMDSTNGAYVNVDGGIATGTNSTYKSITNGSTTFNFNILSGMTGVLDETRVSNSVRSADWITTEYNNQSSPGTFYSIGPEGAVGSPVVSATSSTTLTATWSPVLSGSVTGYDVEASTASDFSGTLLSTITTNTSATSSHRQFRREPVAQHHLLYPGRRAVQRSHDVYQHGALKPLDVEQPRHRLSGLRRELYECHRQLGGLWRKRPGSQHESGVSRPGLYGLRLWNHQRLQPNHECHLEHFDGSGAFGQHHLLPAGGRLELEWRGQLFFLNVDQDRLDLYALLGGWWLGQYLGSHRADELVERFRRRE